MENSTSNIFIQNKPNIQFGLQPTPFLAMVNQPFPLTQRRPQEFPPNHWLYFFPTPTTPPPPSPHRYALLLTHPPPSSPQNRGARNHKSDRGSVGAGDNPSGEAMNQGYALFQAQNKLTSSKRFFREVQKDYSKEIFSRGWNGNLDSR